MSAVDERLRKAMRQLHEKPFQTVAATVTAVDRDELTVDVTPLDGGADIVGVRLRAAIDNGRTGLVLIPAVGSTVLVSTVADNWNSAFVEMVSEVDQLTIASEKESLKTWCKDLLAAIKHITFTTPAGESKFPTNALEFTQLDTRLDNLFLD